MRHGPLLYALATLGHHVSTQAGRTRMDTVCLVQLEIKPTPMGSCRGHYLRAVHALHIDAAVVSEWGSRSAAGRYIAFFTALLGAPKAAANAKVFIVRAS
jgi:hypothetical protein